MKYFSKKYNNTKKENLLENKEEKKSFVLGFDESF